MQSNTKKGNVSYSKVVQFLNKIPLKCLKPMVSCVKVTTDKHIARFFGTRMRVAPACFGRGKTEVGGVVWGFPAGGRVRKCHNLKINYSYRLYQCSLGIKNVRKF